jgi:hypothetical protein
MSGRIEKEGVREGRKGGINNIQDMLNQQTSSHQLTPFFVCIRLFVFHPYTYCLAFWAYIYIFVLWLPSSLLGKQSFVVTADLWLEDEVTDRNLVLVSSIPSSRTAAYTQQQHAAQTQEPQQGIGLLSNYAPYA